MNDGNGRATTDSYTPLNEIDPAEERRMQVEKLLQRQREIPHIYVDEGRTDLANARRFSASFPHKARYCGTWDRWLVWADNRWIVSAGPEIEAIAKEKVKVHWANLGINGTDREGAKEAIRFAKYSSSAAGLRNMLHVARSEEGIPIAPNKLDADPWLLNCENGTLNLRTGELRKHRRDDLITKLCPTPFNPAAECPTLLATLNTIMGGNADLIGFIQRSLGMSLTGVIRDHVLLVCYGTGANGKSTLMNAFLDVIGDYGMKAPLGMLMAKRNESHPTDQADLAGRRFVACNEVEEGQRLAESLVKELTGGDRIRARQLYQDFWEFVPSHHLWLSVNHKPTIRGTDGGIWRRIRLIPFSVTIADEDQDKELPEKLRAERAGILAWTVHGAMEWARHGLGEPDEIRQATGEYRSEQDTMAAFLEECCEVNSYLKIRASALYASYAAWCERAGEYTVSDRRFRQAMTERGFERCRNNGIWYQGIGLRNE